MRNYLLFSMTEKQDHLQEKVAELKGRIDELSSQVKAPKKKGFIETLSSLSTLISGVLIASVATIATITYNNRRVYASYYVTNWV